MTERWLPVVGYEGLYEISDLGHTCSLPRMGTAGKMLKPQVIKDKGYLQVTLQHNGIRKRRKVHHLVLEAFVGPRPAGLQACHDNDINDDNQLTNLRWDTASANILDTVRSGRHRQSRKTRCPKGHAYTGENLIIRIRPKTGRKIRVCRSCTRSRKRAAYYAKKAAA